MRGSRLRSRGLSLALPVASKLPRSCPFSLSKTQAAGPSASLYHGSTSASLLTFWRDRDDATRGQLMKASQMLNQGLVPMSGEMGNLKLKFKQHSSAGSVQ
jgi:hypothetical protein